MVKAMAVPEGDERGMALTTLARLALFQAMRQIRQRMGLSFGLSFARDSCLCGEGDLRPGGGESQSMARKVP
jgi:hypothetical protein